MSCRTSSSRAESAKEHNVVSRTFTPKSHVAAMLYCQVSDVWNSKSREISRMEAEAALFPGGSRLPACRNGTADAVKCQQNREISTSTLKTSSKQLSVNDSS